MEPETSLSGPVLIWLFLKRLSYVKRDKIALSFLGFREASCSPQ